MVLNGSILEQPWYLTTAAVAEQLYDALNVWDAQSSLDITSTSLAFFQDFDSGVQAGSYASSSSTYSTLTKAIKDYADGFLGLNAKYTPSDGALAEQYSKSDGSPASAVDCEYDHR